MNTMTKLKGEALVSAVWRGHKMSRFTPHEFYRETIAVSKCLKCRASVEVNTKPMPNEISIGGEAVAINCK